jgi:hypothetical protein
MESMDPMYNGQSLKNIQKVITNVAAPIKCDKYNSAKFANFTTLRNEMDVL